MSELAANEDRAHRMALALVRFSENEMTAVVAAVGGYCQQLVRAGLSPFTAEAMALQYHAFLVDTMRREQAVPK